MLRVTSLAIRLSCHSHQEIHEKSAQYEEHNSQQRPLHIAPPVHSYCNHAVVRRGIFCTAPAQFVFVPWTCRINRSLAGTVMAQDSGVLGLAGRIA